MIARIEFSPPDDQPTSFDMSDPSAVIAEIPAGAIPGVALAVKVKRRSARMRACSEMDAKAKLCAGHLKRWFTAPAAVTAEFGVELYRCEKCHTIYLPHPEEQPRTGTLSW
jgi:hypothetical protein